MFVEILKKSEEFWLTEESEINMTSVVCSEINT